MVCIDVPPPLTRTTLLLASYFVLSVNQAQVFSLTPLRMPSTCSPINAKTPKPHSRLVRLIELLSAPAHCC